VSDFPQVNTLPQFIHPWTVYGPGPDIRLAASGLNPVAFTWVGNSAVYIPMTIPWAYPVNRVWWVNGSTVTTANCDFGIYTASGSRIYSTGSTTQANASSPQFVTPSTPFILDPGNYYFAWTCDSTTSHAFAVAITTAAQASMVGLYSQATALPLPATATFASMGTSLGVPLCGVTRTPSGF
jgi:hypothetical protein